LKLVPKYALSKSMLVALVQSFCTRTT